MPGSSVHEILQVRILESVAIPFSKGSFQPRDQTQVSHIVGRSLPDEPQGKPNNNGLGSLSFLQWIFLTQELNQGLLHCKRIVYHYHRLIYYNCLDLLLGCLLWYIDLCVCFCDQE